MSNQKFRSILDELAGSTAAPARDRDQFIEYQAQQVMASVSHLMNLIRETYDPETAEDLQKRLVNSIRTEDERKFRRKMKELREAKK
jgi:hypothetical protein